MQYVIYAQSESGDMEGPLWGFWSDEDGWCHLSNASVYGDKSGALPIATHNDAEWVALPTPFASAHPLAKQARINQMDYR